MPRWESSRKNKKHLQIRRVARWALPRCSQLKQWKAKLSHRKSSATLASFQETGCDSLIRSVAWSKFTVSGDSRRLQPATFGLRHSSHKALILVSTNEYSCAMTVKDRLAPIVLIYKSRIRTYSPLPQSMDSAILLHTIVLVELALWGNDRSSMKQSFDIKASSFWEDVLETFQRFHQRNRYITSYIVHSNKNIIVRIEFITTKK